MSKKDLRVGLYGLSAAELEIADSQGLSPWDFAERYKGCGELKPLTPDEKKQEWQELFMERLTEQIPHLKIWMDGDANLWLGWFRKDGVTGIEMIVIVAKLQIKSQTIVAVPMRRESTDVVDGVVWWRPWMAQQVWEKIKSWRRIVPPGVF